jgi:Domain of unknown function (DUF4345)
MSFDQILNYLGATITTAMGLMGLITPRLAAKFTGLQATNKTAFAEFRATFGGMFVVMGLLPMLIGSTLVFSVIGCIWLGAAIGRLTSVFLDEGYKEVKNIAGIGFEAAIGFLLLAGSPYLKTHF